MPQPLSSRRFGAVLFASLLVLVAVVYRDALQAWFAADDFHWLEIGTLPDVLHSFVGPWGHGPAYRPLARLSFFLDLKLFGLDARFWHADSLLLLTIDATLLGVLVDRVSGERRLAIASAALFAIFPTGYENAIWISGRVHLLGMGFSLLALVLWDAFLLTAARRDALLALVAYALALLSYEASLYVLPLGALIALARRPRIASVSAVARAAVLAIALSALYLAARRLAVGSQMLYPVRSIASLAEHGLVAQRGSAARRLLLPLEPLWWPLAAAAVVSAVAAPRLLAIAATGLVVAVIGFLPFALIAGPIATRFVFASQAGISIAIAAVLAGVARVPWAGKPIALLLLLATLECERRETEQIAHEWRIAGESGRRVLAAIAEATPEPSADGIVVVLGTPFSSQRAMIFNTYFDAAVRLFEPSYGRFAVPAQDFQNVGRTPEETAQWLGTIWGLESERRAASGLPELPCDGARAALASGVGPFLEKLIACRTVFLSVEMRTQTVRRIDPAAAARALTTRTLEAPPTVE